MQRPVAILIVEDENIVAMNLERKLVRLGYSIAGIASSADSAVQQAHEKLPQLVLMDIALKGSEDGIDAARRIQDLDIPIVYLSALSDDATVNRVRETDPFGYIVKPPEEKSLHMTIEIALYKHRLQSQLRQEIAARKEMEEVLKRYSTELERSNAELERFAAVASHDLSEPLNTVFSCLRLLQRESQDSLSSKAREYLDYALKAVPRMAELIKDLLAYSRAGKEKKTEMPVDCNEIYRTITANLAAAIRESGAQVTCDPLPVLYFDERELGQLFQNLISNALKYRGEKNPRIHIQCNVVNGEWQFSFRDNGIGIGPGDREKIFVPFVRIRSQDSEGTGIGLAICKKIVEAHHGKIWVESKEGEGSTFHFTLPVSQAQETKILANA